MESLSIAVLGAGNAGTTLANTIAVNGHDVRLWTVEDDVAEDMRSNRENTKYLPGIGLRENVRICGLEESLDGAGFIVLAVPSTVVRAMCGQIKPFLKHYQVLINVAKGIEEDTLMLMSDVIADAVGEDNHIIVISGPMIANELARGIPTAVAIAGTDEKAQNLIQKSFSTDFFKLYKNEDMVGVELGGSLKNIIAIAAGISDGLGYGSNTKSALITRGLAEISHLGAAMGGRPLTFSGLSGLGDLYTTCTSKHSRNRRFGENLGMGMNVEEARKKVEQVVEGIFATKVGYQLGKKHGIDLPITNILYGISHEGRTDVRAEMSDFMQGFNEVHF